MAEVVEVYQAVFVNGRVVPQLDKEEVNNARPLIAKVLKWLQELFPREEGTHGYCIPKMHGMTKFQSYI